MTKKVKEKSTNNDIDLKKPSDFKLRLISGIVLFILMVIYVGLGAIYTQSQWDNKEIAAWFNYVITLVLVGLSMYELIKMLNIGTKDTWYLVAVGITLAEMMFIFPVDGHINQPLFLYLDLTKWLKWYIILIFVIVIFTGLFLLGYFTGSAMSGLYLVLYSFLIVFGFKGFSVISLSLFPNFGFNSIIFTWGTVVLTDTFAYFGGRRFGKHKMAPEISPKKTWEGAAIGTTTAVVIASLYGALFYYLLPDFAPFVPMLKNSGDMSVALPGIIVVVLALLISIAGQMGDLVFSYLKRVHDKKDYSNLIPGHGGILDRFDSFLLVFMLLYFVAMSVSGMGVI